MPKVEDGKFMLKSGTALDSKYISQNSIFTFLDCHPDKNIVENGKLKLQDKDGNTCDISAEVNDHHLTSLELADNHKQLKVAPSLEVMKSDDFAKISGVHIAAKHLLGSLIAQIKKDKMTDEQSKKLNGINNEFKKKSEAEQYKQSFSYIRSLLSIDAIEKCYEKTDVVLAIKNSVDVAGFGTSRNFQR